MSRGTKIALWILVLLGIGVVWLMAYNSGYTLGSDTMGHLWIREGKT